MPNPESPSQNPDSKKLLREKLFLAEQAAQGNLKVLPGDRWAFHYPNGSVKEERLKDLMEGRLRPEDVAPDLKPDALIYNAEDIEREGLEAVSAKIRDISARVQYYNYDRYADFIASMQGKDADIGTVKRLYDGIAQSRIRKIMVDALGFTGRKQIEMALRADAAQAVQKMQSMPRVNKVLEALKMNWLCENMQYARSEQRDQAVSQLSEEERKLFEQLKKPYQDYVQKGENLSYEELVKKVQETIPQIKQKPQSENNHPHKDEPKTESEDSHPHKDEPKTESEDSHPHSDDESESMQKLREELEKIMEQVVPPGMPDDPAIPPDDKDEYHTPPPSPTESKEKAGSRPIFEIRPKGASKAPLIGEYCSGRKSYFDKSSKTWSKKKKLTPYNTPIQGDKRQSISGVIEGDIKSLPLPNNYALDASSLQYSGAKPEIYRDQNGCFYLKANGRCEFSIDFLKEPSPHTGHVIPEDTQPLYQGALSARTETMIAGLNGSNLKKAQQAQKYILDNHYYPGGGDLNTAQALQYKLRNESSGDDYLQNLDASEYLECYSANTLFVAMMRKAGIPAKLVVGHKIDSASEGRAVIDSSTGHAWAEIWDGNRWVRIDATPQPKPEDKKPDSDDKKGSDGTPTEKADDGEVAQPEEGSQRAEGENQQSQEGGQDSSSSSGQAESQNADQRQSGSEGAEGESQQDNLTDQVKDRSQQTTDAMQDQQSGQSGEASDSEGQSGEMGEASDSDMQNAESDLQEAKEMMEQMKQKKQELEQKAQQADSFQELKDLHDEVEKNDDLLDDMKEDIEQKLEAKEEQMKEKIKDQLDQMVKDGFLDENVRDELEKQLEQNDLAQLDDLKRRIEEENHLHNEYMDIKEEVGPLVDEWFKYFAERLPRKKNIEVDEDSRTRYGTFDRKSVMKPRNLLFGTVKNPRIIKPSIEPRFMASIEVDVSGSMNGQKIRMALKLLIFYCELFERIGNEFGYIRSAINIFSNFVSEIKGFDMDYDSMQKYQYDDGALSTVKLRLMKAVRTSGGTNMLDAIKKAAHDLNEQTFEYPDYASAFYFIGDGGDTCGNSHNIKNFLHAKDSEYGFGDHMLSATMLGDESQRQELAQIFGDENTTVAPDFDELIEQSMQKFDEDIEWYLEGKTE